MKKLLTFCLIASVATLLVAMIPITRKGVWYEVALRNAEAQMRVAIDSIEASGEVLNPYSCTTEGEVTYCDPSDWRSGFFPGSVWLLYELTQDSALLPMAHKYTEAIESAKRIRWNHDVGFIIQCSFGNGLRLTDKRDYEEVITTAAASLCSRFRPAANVLQSWDVTGKGWQSLRGWECPVIIDNMMNLELLFEATRLSGDSTYYNIAVSHADRTLQEHFRTDGSCYHVVDYSPEDGTVRSRQTAQGYADGSAWARGQAWAIYGFTMCYRMTGKQDYLDQAIATFNFMRNHPNMPADCVPYWDMDAPNIPNEPRDASAAAVIASALYELAACVDQGAKGYKLYADQILESLASAAYSAPIGENGRFLLMHSVGSIPHNKEVDVPLNYADYYYMEALLRKMRYEEKQLESQK